LFNYDNTLGLLTKRWSIERDDASVIVDDDDFVGLGDLDLDDTVRGRRLNARL
jgi:hypothetical protein